MEKKQNVPALRFQGFSGEWEKYNLSMLSGVITKGTTPLDKSGKGDVNFIKIENIDANTGAIHVTQKISQEEHNGYLKRSQLKENDILFSIAGTLGRVAVVKANLLPANTNQALAIIRLKKGNFQYVKTYLQGKAVENFLKANPTVGAQPNLSLAQVGDLEVVMPEESKEQENISDFFQYWDELIFHTMAKIKRLRQFRQAMLTKLFPWEGAAEPELRFRGFSGKWRIRTLAKCAALHARIGWQNLRKSEFLTKGDYYLITGTDFVDGQIEWRTCHYVSKLRYDQDKNIQVQNGDILVTKDGTLGKVAYVDGADKPATLNAGVFNVKINVNDVDAKYLYQYLKGPYLMDYVNQRATGGTIKHLNQNILVDFPVVMPSFEEQKIIGDFFYRLDRYISLQQKKLERMQRLKAALLEKLFV